MCESFGANQWVDGATVMSFHVLFHTMPCAAVRAKDT
jgi:hypothetical protein